MTEETKHVPISDERLGEMRDELQRASGKGTPTWVELNTLITELQERRAHSLPSAVTDEMVDLGYQAFIKASDWQDWEAAEIKSLIRTALSAALSLPIAQPAGVRVKPLEWDPGKRVYFQGRGILGWLAYVSAKDDDGYTGAFWYKRQPFETLEAAQSAADADYASRILSAIEAAPPIDRASVIEALQAARGLAETMRGLSGCRSDDEWVWAAQEKIEAALRALTHEAK